MTEGQELALEQLREIEAAGSELEIMGLQPPGDDSPGLLVQISVYCGNFKRVPTGLPLKQRERFQILIPPDFPFKYPTALTPHTRFEDFAHVQWRRQLCLYQAPSTEWDVSDGIYGFIHRLADWLEKGAVDELDPTGGALHPPVAYLGPGDYRLVVPRVDTPTVGSHPWLGTVEVNALNDSCIELLEWRPLGVETALTPEQVAAVLLLPSPMPFEYPRLIGDLIAELEERSVPPDLLLLILQNAILQNKDAAPLYVVLGSPMRGIRGGRLQQHLTVWYLAPKVVDVLRLALRKHSSSPSVSELGKKAEEIILDWAREARVEWCSVGEDRPEIVTRRDHSSPMEWFAGKTVAVWGCGALGSNVSEFLLRAGVRRLVLRDYGLVKPGLLARQQYATSEFGEPKARALKNRLDQIGVNTEIEASVADILKNPLGEDDWTDGVDVVIDTTASEQVLAKLELHRKESTCSTIPVVSMAIGHTAQHGLVVLSCEDHSGGAADVVRRAKLAVCGDDRYQPFADEFWPRDRHPNFQPEPGCSDATFVGSAADSAAMAGMMLNAAASMLANEQGRTAAARFLTQPTAMAGAMPSASFEWVPDIILPDPHSGYEVRLSPSAWAEMRAWIERSRRTVGLECETGGLLFGERDDSTRTVWVSEVSGPPPDSEASPELFLCGTSGTVELHEEKRSRARRSVEYIGMWHTHPQSAPLPSETDIAGMNRLTSAATNSPPKSLLLIVGRPYHVPTIGAFIFSRKDFQTWKEEGVITRSCAISASDHRNPSDESIGLALSGGGSRAVAFHLGVLRALHDREILQRVKVLSSVSGGSVIAAMWAYSSDSFDEFDARVARFLRRGLTASLLLRAVRPSQLLGAAGTTALAGLSAAITSVSRMMAGSSSRLFSRSSRARRHISNRLQAPLRRWMSRTVAFEAALRERLFRSTCLSDERRGDIEVILNACELRTGTRFQFGSSSSGCWRFGKLLDNEILVAHAVAASAAYPALLPALDEEFEFVNGSGDQQGTSRERVILTDGGVYDNLGILPLDPSQVLPHSCRKPQANYIICSDAGAGQFGGDKRPYWWPARMQRSFETTFRKNLNGGYARLHAWRTSGRIRGFVFPYLGQQDDELPYTPPDLVRREEVIGYPTDFSPMSDQDIDLLSTRGEQLTRILIQHYCPNL